MNRTGWVDTAIGTAVFGLTAALGEISAYLAPPARRGTLYALCVSIALLAAAQTVRAVRRALHRAAPRQESQDRVILGLPI